MTDIATLDRLLDDLETDLPQIMADNPEPGAFWMAFTREAEVVEDMAGEHAEHVSLRIDAMLSKHGHFIASIRTEE